MIFDNLPPTKKKKKNSGEVAKSGEAKIKAKHVK